MKHVLALLLAFVSLTLQAQIPVTKVASEPIINPTATVVVYDSTLNFVGTDAEKLMGQDLYLPGKHEGLRKYGYSHFYTTYAAATDQDRKKTYKCCDTNGSKYADLEGKTFKVLGALKDYELENVYVLKLQERDSKDIVYYRYDGKDAFNYPFIVMGFYNWFKATSLGKEFLVTGRNWIEEGKPMMDIYTGKPVTFTAGSKWKAVDLTIEDKYFTLSLILENEKGEKIPLSYDKVNNYKWVVSTTISDVYIEKWGNEKFFTLLDGEVKFGDNQEMTRFAQGNPIKITKTDAGEEWEYAFGTLTFKDGVIVWFEEPEK